ncbi:MAG: SAM-dependent methyltransferase [Spirosomataceae bacterium]
MLYLIPTTLAPDTSATVLTPQINEVIAQTDYFLVENVRTARRFISELKLGKVIDQLHFFELTKDTSEAEAAAYFKQIPSGQNIGVISEAGCPGVADPGALAVKIAHRMGMRVVPLVGPSSILLALMASGMSGQSFVFHGYLPIEKGERVKKIRQLEKEGFQKHQTQIFMETPYRNNQLLADLLANCQNDTVLCVAANITAPDELIQTKTVRQWKETQPDLHKKPTIFLIG